MVSRYKEEYALWRKCFLDTEEYTDYYFTEKTRDNKILKMFKENELVSMVHLNPYEIFWQGELCRLYYIVGVCTEEGHRKRGYMRKLLKEAFQLMEAEGCPFTYLMPAKKEIYEPFGFRFIYTQKRLRGRLFKEEVKAAQHRLESRHLVQEELFLKSYRELTTKLQEKTADFQNQKLKESFDVYAVRGPEYLHRLSLEMEAAKGGLLVLYDRTGEIRGTLSYMTETGEEALCEVTEAILNPADTQQLLQLFAAELFKRNALWQISFLELGFWKEETLSEFLEEAVSYEKPILMAKVLKEGKEQEKLWQELKKARVYLNEIV